jgi:inositol phosphorylceramide mannosyltransferase catalytic subunit
MNPDWDYRLYDDADIAAFIRQHYPLLLPLYERINPVYGAARADFFRYLVIYHYGGVYLDVKATCSAPLSSTIRPEDSFVTAHWNLSVSGDNDDGRVHHDGISNPKGEIQQWHLIAAKGHPLLKRVIENVCNNILQYNPYLHGSGSWGVWNLTGPIAYTSTITANRGRFDIRIVDGNERLGLVYSACQAENAGDGLFTAHRRFANGAHYSQRTDSLVLLHPINDLIFKATKPIRSFVKARTLDRPDQHRR